MVQKTYQVHLRTKHSIINVWYDPFNSGFCCNEPALVPQSCGISIFRGLLLTSPARAWQVTFFFIDQNQREHVIDAFRPDLTSASFHRPVSEMNVASGCPLFFPLGKLKSPKHAYCKDDTIYIKCVVDISSWSMKAWLLRRTGFLREHNNSGSGQNEYGVQRNKPRNIYELKSWRVLSRLYFGSFGYMNKIIFLDWHLALNVLNIDSFLCYFGCIAVLFIIEWTLLDFEHHSDSFHILCVIINKMCLLPCFLFPHSIVYLLTTCLNIADKLWCVVIYVFKV